MRHILEADSIQLQFDGRKILSDIYLKCETGKITGLLGGNGQGKTCLMQIIYGTLKCEGSVRIDGQVISKRNLLHYLPQFNFIPKSLSLKRVFSDFGLDYAEFAERFQGSASSVRSSIGSLSGGEQRLVELYVILKPPSFFVLLDEPFTHLSPLQVEQVKALILEEKNNKGLLITDHLFTHITDLCDDLLVLTAGKLWLTKSRQDIEMLGYARLRAAIPSALL